MRYETGIYHLHLFDKHGVKLETRMRPNLLEAQEEGRGAIRMPPAASFAITRVLYNSIDTAHPWDLSPEEIARIKVSDEILTETFGPLDHEVENER